MSERIGNMALAAMVALILVLGTVQESSAQSNLPTQAQRKQFFKTRKYQNLGITPSQYGVMTPYGAPFRNQRMTGSKPCMPTRIKQNYLNASIKKCRWSH